MFSSNLSFASLRCKMQVLQSVFLIVFCSLLIKSQSCPIQKVKIACALVPRVIFTVVGTLFRCQGDSSITSTFPDAAVSTVVHSNGSEVTNLLQIEALWISGAKVKFIPNGIKRHFPNLKAVSIQWCGVVSVNMENLREFGSALEYLDLNDNKITSINADLFEHNSNLKVITMQGNPIRHIEPELFTNLMNMKSIAIVDLTAAGCISQKFYTSRYDKMATFKWKYERCSDETVKINLQNMIDRESCLETKITEIINKTKASTSNAMFELIENSVKMMDN